ncbi:MAG TPA: hypothetical protein VEH27_09000 [Methylomirabilota bacterium]|nr:hypothetical protein [Methylomirabilota bacterium]
MKNSSLAVAAVAALVTQAALHPSAQAQDWKEKVIEPVANPLFFEDPHINSEVRPLFVHHNIDNGFITGGGEARVYAMQLRYALTERLALIATKDGFIEFSGNGLGDDWADLAAGLKYALIDDRENQFVLTPGLKIELPTGNSRVFQGNGQGEWDFFVSSAKGIGNFHVTGSVGARVPNDFSEETSSAHYSLQLDYFAHRYFIPFVVANGFTVLSEADGPALDVEGYDIINFGSSAAGGFTQVTAGVGFRSRVHENVDLGFAYEKAVTTPKGLFDNRFTVDLVWRF